MTGVPIDVYLSGVGEQLEDLEQVVPKTRYRFTGTVLTTDDVRVLEDGMAATGGPPPRSLVDAGLADQRGAFSPIGDAIHHAMAEPAGRVHVESSQRSGTTSFSAWFLDGRAVVVATERPVPVGSSEDAELPSAPGTTVRLDWMDAAQVPAAIAAWVGLRPAWNLATEPAMLPEAEVVARCEDPRAPAPTGADAHLRHVWAQPWTPWTLATTGFSHGRSMVNTGRTGQFEISGAEDGLVAFQARPSSTVWIEIVELTAAASAGHRL